MNPNLSFEEALQQLETIVKALEVGNLPLEESMKKYQEGLSLAQHCQSLLQKAETLLAKMEKNGEWIDIPKLSE